MPALVSGFEYDIFISYRHNDNSSGWVTEFVKALREELAATIKDSVSVYLDTNPHDGLLETHNVDKSLEGKLKCLIFIPIISQTYCDTNSFAWQQEFCAFNKMAKEGQLGRDIKLSNGNVASRILPIKIHDIDTDDKTVIENEISGVLRAIEFIYKEAGVNRPLKSTDNKNDNQNKTDYKNQVNKVANSIKELISALKNPITQAVRTTGNEQPTTKPRRNRKAIIASFALLLLLVISYFLYQQRVTSNDQSAQLDNSIAVLPFDDLSPLHDQEYFGIGMMDEILNHLTKIGDLAPVSRTSSMIYKKSGKDLKQIAKELSVVYILEGSISRSGDAYKITAQLINASNDRHIWSESYERPAKDIFAIQSEVAQKVAKELSVKISPDAKKRMEIIPTKSQEAYDLFLQVHAKLQTEEDVIPLLEKIIQLDSNFSRAYSDLAFRWLLKGYWAGKEDPESVKKKVIILIRKAIKLDPSNSEAYSLRAQINLFFNWQLDSALADMQTAERLNPSRSDLGHIFQVILCPAGRFEESLKKSIFYFNRDRNIPSNWVGLGNSYFYAGQPKKALETLEGALKFLNVKYLSNENEVVMELGQLKIFTQDWQGALNVLEPISKAGYPLFHGYMGIAYAHLGERAKAKSLVNQLHHKSDQTSLGSPAYFAAAVHTALDEKDEAIKWLEVAYANREVEMYWIKITPIFDPLRNDPRFKSIISKMGFK